MISSPARVATARYKDAFESKIFAPAELRNVKHPPAGKRRDQRTSELFGTAVDDKDLRRQAPTFQPKVDPLSPRRRKLKFLQGGTVPEHNAVDIMNMPPHGHYRAEMLGFEEDTSGKIDPRSDPCVRRQQDLESYIFEEHENMNHADDILTKQRWNDKITPNSFNWYNSEPTLKGPAHDQPGTSHKDRAYHEKSSNVFDHRTVPQKTKEELQRVHNEEMQQEIDATLKRKANVYYSDLFNRPTPGYENQTAGDIIIDSNGSPRTSCGAGQGGGYLNHPNQQGSYGGYNMSGYYPRKMADDDSAITVNAEWTDARTEIMRHKAQQGRPMTAQERKFDELHQTNIPESPRHHALVPRPGPIETDTSQKVKRDTPGELGMHVHQKHMKSSLVRDEFYERADKVKAWEVAEIALAAVPRTADERTVRDVCKGFECQLVKVHLDVDPISNLCKGRAKLVLRYNPDSNGLGGLIGKLQSLGWQVAFLDDN